MILAPPKKLWTPPRRIVAPPPRCPKCRGRLPRARRQRVAPHWRGGVRTLNADGDTLIDDDGNISLDASGNEYVAGASVSDCTCCGEEFCLAPTGCSACPGPATPDAWTVTFSGVEICTECTNPSNVCAGLCGGHGLLTTGTLDGTYCLSQGVEFADDLAVVPIGCQWAIEVDPGPVVTKWYYTQSDCTGDDHFDFTKLRIILRKFTTGPTAGKLQLYAYMGPIDPTIRGACVARSEALFNHTTATGAAAACDTSHTLANTVTECSVLCVGDQDIQVKAGQNGSATISPCC